MFAWIEVVQIMARMHHINRLLASQKAHLHSSCTLVGKSMRWAAGLKK
jgi:hypothetical protein